MLLLSEVCNWTLPSSIQSKLVFLGTSDKELDKLISSDIRTKDDFEAFSKRIIDYIIKRHQGKPLYASFVEFHARELAMPLKDIEVRKVASALTTLSNEKQKEQRDKTSGKKKTKAAAKPILGSTKAISRYDQSRSFLFKVIDRSMSGMTLASTTRPWMTSLTVSCDPLYFLATVLMFLRKIIM